MARFAGAVTVKNLDKAGYSLTAGSYVIRASSSQLAETVFSGSMTNSFTITISSVTTTRAAINDSSSRSDEDLNFGFNVTSFSATTVTLNRESTASASGAVAVHISEYF